MIDQRSKPLVWVTSSDFGEEIRLWGHFCISFLWWIIEQRDELIECFYKTEDALRRENTETLTGSGSQ